MGEKRERQNETVSLGMRMVELNRRVVRVTVVFGNRRGNGESDASDGIKRFGLLLQVANEIARAGEEADI